MNKSELQQIIKEELRSVLSEKAKSQSQQQAAGIALAVKKGKAPRTALKGASKAMVKMSSKELEKIAKTKHKGLPKVKEEAAPIRNEAKGKKIKGGIVKHFNDFKGTDTHTSLRELEDILMYYAQDPSKPLDLDEIADIILDIIDDSNYEAIMNYKQEQGTF